MRSHACCQSNDRSGIGDLAEVDGTNRGEYAFGYPNESFCDLRHLRCAAPRVYLDNPRPDSDRHAVAGKTPQYPVDRSGQRYGGDLGDFLPGVNRVPDAGLSAKDARDRRVHVGVAGTEV